MPSQFASDFMLDLGGVVGYIDQIQRKIWCEVGRQIVGMNFQTRSKHSQRKFQALEFCHLHLQDNAHRMM